jgi:hypothetical protein
MSHGFQLKFLKTRKYFPKSHFDCLNTMDLSNDKLACFFSCSLFNQKLDMTQIHVQFQYCVLMILSKHFNSFHLSSAPNSIPIKKLHRLFAKRFQYTTTYINDLFKVVDESLRYDLFFE